MIAKSNRAWRMECEALRQRVKDLEGCTGMAYKEGYESGSKDERAISDKLEKGFRIVGIREGWE